MTHSFKKVSKNPEHPATALTKGQGEQTLVVGLKTLPAGQET